MIVVIVHHFVLVTIINYLVNLALFPVKFRKYAGNYGGIWQNLNQVNQVTQGVKKQGY